METEREFTVGVTAFGLYTSTHPFNVSNLILAALPWAIKNPAGAPFSIRILKFPVIKVTYEAVSGAMPSIWNAGSEHWESAPTEGNGDHEEGATEERKIDLVLHLGQMRSFAGYSFEKLAHRDNYVIPDIEDELPVLDSRNETDGTPVEARFAVCPAVLRPDVDVEEVTSKVKGTMPDTLIRASTEAGRFICEYTLYSSLAELWKRGEPKKVLFMHAPAKNSPRDIQKGVDVAIAFLKTVFERVDHK